MSDFAFVAKGGTILDRGGLERSGLSIGTGHGVEFIEWKFASASAGAVLAELDVELPEDARVETGHFEVAADPVDPAVITSVATLRPSSPVNSAARGACSVDFGRLVTMGGLVLTSGVFTVLSSASIDRSYRWTGSNWQLIGSGVSFAEVAAERILFESDDSSSDAVTTFLGGGTYGISLPQTPSGLELLIDGTTVWFERQGGSPITLPGPLTSHSVAYAVDRTSALREALSRAAGSGGKKKVRVGLRASTPGRLTLVPHVGALRVHTHTFTPDGLQRAFDLAEEGRFVVDVSPPGAADVREVALDVRGSFGPGRVQPPTAPPLSAAGSLTLAPGRPLLIGLPRETLRRFGKISGVRVHLTAGGSSGCEVSGRLLASVARRPDAPLAGGDLVAVSLPSGASGWQTLALADAIDVPRDEPEETAHATDAAHPLPDVGAWLEIQLGYGEATCATTSAAPTAVSGPGAPVVRRLPGGGTKGLTVIQQLGPLHAATRIVGLPDRDRPIPAVSLAVAGSAEVVGINPTADPVQTLITLQTPLAVTGPVLLEATVTAPGSVVLDTIRVTYREAAT